MRFSLRSSASDSLAERCSWICAQVAEAKGGVLLVDEAYSIVKGEQHQNDSYGKEAIETIMKHLDPPTCVRRAFPSVTAQSVPPGSWRAGVYLCGLRPAHGGVPQGPPRRSERWT